MFWFSVTTIVFFLALFVVFGLFIYYTPIGDFIAKFVVSTATLVVNRAATYADLNTTCIRENVIGGCLIQGKE